MKKVIVITGPTAVGKSHLGILLAKKLKTSIISGDSVQVYKELNIGSGKIKKDEMEGIKHYLIDTLDYQDDYSVSNFQKEARKLMNEIDVPLIVGGTGLYIKASLSNYQFDNPKRDNNFALEYQDLSNEALYNLLLEKDELQAKLIHPNNRKRVLRALECALGEHKMSQNQDKDSYLYDAYIIYLSLDRKILYEKINKRVDMMFEEGLVDEVTSLYNKYGFLKPAIGYQEFNDYFLGNKSLDLVKEEIKLNSRHLAKRQETWFKHQMNGHFYDVSQADVFDKIYQDVLKFLKG